MAPNLDYKGPLANRQSSAQISGSLEEALDKNLKSIGWLYVKKILTPQIADKNMYDILLGAKVAQFQSLDSARRD